MNYWIETAPEALTSTIALVDCVLLNETELRMLTGEWSLVAAARAIQSLGPRIVVAKQGRYGAAVFTDEGYFAVPSYPFGAALDPTGAGDAFAGGFFGYLATHGAELTDAKVRCALVYGSVMASFNVEAFGSERVMRLTDSEIRERFFEFKKMTHFEPLPVPALAGRGPA